jgi:hypothetical protein
MRKHPVLRAFGLLVLALGVTLAVILIWGDSSTTTEDAAVNYPTLSTAEALKQAMAGKEQRYLIDNLPLEGTPVKTRFDILQGDYVYLNFVYEHLVVKSRTDSMVCRTTTWNGSGSARATRMPWRRT